MVCVKRKWGGVKGKKDICENDNVFTTLKEASVEQVSTLVNIYKVINLHMNRLCFVLYSILSIRNKRYINGHNQTDGQWETNT
jgi:hypothetical protein